MTVDDLPYEKRFHFADGSAAKDLAELKNRIESLSYDEFYRHVNSEKNDFANWVESVLTDHDLANRLRAVSSIVETIELLNEVLYPEETVAAEQKLGQDDFQLRIEEQLFSDVEQPPKQVEEEVPEIPEAPKKIVTEEPSAAGEKESVESPVAEEPSLPSREELEFKGRVPGAPVTTNEPKHVPVTERVDRPVSHEEHMRFLIWQSAIGFVIGLIIGFLLGRILSIV